VELLSSEPSPPTVEDAAAEAASSATPSVEGDDVRARAGVFTGASSSAPPVYDAKPRRRKAKPRAGKKPDNPDDSESE
jgi:hypothetical protein